MPHSDSNHRVCRLDHLVRTAEAFVVQEAAEPRGALLGGVGVPVEVAAPPALQAGARVLDDVAGLQQSADEVGLRVWSAHGRTA